MREQEQSQPRKKGVPKSSEAKSNKASFNGVNGFVIGGIFMAPRPELTPDEQNAIQEIIRNMRTHRS